MYLAQNLRYLREQKGRPQNEMANVFGISQSTVGNWEQNHRKPEIEMLVRLAEYFEVTLDNLVLQELKPNLPLYVSNIKHLRKQYDMTQEDMANLLGKGKKTYQAIETGKMATMKDLEKIADFFGLTWKQLVKQDLSEGVE